VSEARRPAAASEVSSPTGLVAPDARVIYPGDCIEVMRSWRDGSIGACIADPPYNMSRKKGLRWAFSTHVTMQESWDRFSGDEYFDFTRRWLTEVTRVVRENGNILVFASFHNVYLIGFILQSVLRRRVMQQMTWFKPNAQPNITGRLPTESTEYVIWACNNTPEKATRWVFDYAAAKEMNGGKQLRNLWEIPCTPRSERVAGSHPAQKPLALAERLVRLWTAPDEAVLDCFLGTGTTALACEKLGRPWIGIEKDPGYVEIAQRRISELTRASASSA
jgi:DNA modification methylase